MKRSSDSPTPAELGNGEALVAAVLAVLGFLGLLIFLVRSSPPEQARVMLDAVTGFGTVLLSLLGSGAALWWFRRRDPLRPRVNIEQKITVLESGEEWTLIQVAADLTNAGEIPVRISEWRLWANRLLPTPAHLTEALASADTPADSEIAWTSCAGRHIEREDLGEVRIRPGECHRIAALMRLPAAVEVVRIYSAIPHPAINLAAGEDRVWTQYDYVDLRTERDR